VSSKGGKPYAPKPTLSRKEFLLSGLRKELFRVGDYIQKDISVPFNAEVKTPAAIDPRLPDVAGLIVLFSP